MERKEQRRLRECGVPLDANEPMHAFAVGIGPNTGEPLQPIPRENWQEEIAAMAAEEADFWKGKSVSIQLMVELPFWLLIPDSEFPVAHQDTRVSVSVRGAFVEVSAGNMFYDSHRNAVFVGPAAELQSGNPPPSVAEVEMPIYRDMKTVVLFRPAAMEEAILALQEHEALSEEDPRKIRRTQRAMQYLQSLAYAHIPFLNELITSYRFASRDPFAFQVSAWDVPVWFAQHNATPVRICLMPYRDNDTYPSVRRFGTVEESPFFATSPDAVTVQVRGDVAPGTLEILDAQSLMYRGHILTTQFALP